MRKIYAKGLTVKKDITGKWCCIGDRISIQRMFVRSDQSSGHWRLISNYGVRTGTLVLHKTKGIVLKYDRVVLDQSPDATEPVIRYTTTTYYDKLRFTEHGRCKQEWVLVSKG